MKKNSRKIAVIAVLAIIAILAAASWLHFRPAPFVGNWISFNAPPSLSGGIQVVMHIKKNGKGDVAQIPFDWQPDGSSGFKFEIPQGDDTSIQYSCVFSGGKLSMSTNVDMGSSTFVPLGH